MLSQEPAPTHGILICFTGRWIGAQRDLQKKSHSSLLLWPNALVMSPLYWPVCQGWRAARRYAAPPCVTWGKPHGITVSALSGIVELTVQPDVIEERHGTSVLSLLTDGQVKAQLPESLYAH